MNITELESIFASEQKRILTEWQTFLKFPSISADPLYNSNCRDCAEWLASHLQGIGFESELLETSTKPVVFAERKGSPDKPTVLFYGHYDVQPIDPENAWETPPFAPTLRNGRLYARGAEDNKGQVFYTLKALETLIQNDGLDAPVKVIIEGEEEYGSAALTEHLDAWADRLKADILMVHDTGTVRAGNPTIVMGLRGIVHLTVELEGPDHDLHSGVHGGLAPNPAQGMGELLSGLFNADGSVAVSGFYDGVRAPTERELTLASETPFDAEAYKHLVGTSPDGGKENTPPAERVGFLPSLDINGVHSGYGGAGMKTIIPSKAITKLSARLVPDQDPAGVLESITGHIYRNVPKGMRLTISDQGVGGPGFRLFPESPLVRKAQAALEDLNAGSVAYLWEGASIPIVTGLAATSGAEPLLVGFGHEEDRIHAPNESFSIEQFKSGYLYAALMLQSL
ncbi:MAG: M20/M25/M40 family metallo-hydrolase [Verrucomicrobia bacterium]|jgi:acetylornithine deacetylase/succinyl-diaminopimelate desuccinylase-like protein|nr:M20/M25/M40 family metallo-hydrolase [Verrucomicrobiota bacterium]